MIEPNLTARRKLSGSVLSVSFETDTVGATSFIDRGIGKRVFTRKQMTGTAVGQDGVVNDPTHGKCYQFNGITYFDSTDILQFSRVPHRIEIDFVPKDKTRSNALFRSGDFTGHGIVPGTLVYLNADPNQYIRAMLTGPSYEFLSLPGVQPLNLMEKLVITRSGPDVIIVNNRTGVTKTFRSALPSGDSYCAFGCLDSLAAATSFVGLLKRLEITLL